MERTAAISPTSPTETWELYLNSTADRAVYSDSAYAYLNPIETAWQPVIPSRKEIADLAGQLKKELSDLCLQVIKFINANLYSLRYNKSFRNDKKRKLCEYSCNIYDATKRDKHGTNKCKYRENCTFVHFDDLTKQAQQLLVTDIEAVLLQDDTNTLPLNVNMVEYFSRV